MANFPTLGELQAVDLQSVWQHEGSLFTPWLLANPSALGAVLGMDLSLSAAEHPVGDFWLDLIGRDEATNTIVIIENQLTKSDHDHLGKLLTYAGGTDATNVVWVAKHFRGEHRAALEWLNARTDENTRFFAVEVGAVRIGDSPPAPLFRVVVQPNDWGKVVKAVTTPTTTPKGLVYAEFWAQLLQQVSDRGLGWTNSTKAPKANWLGLPAGHDGVAYYCSFTKNGLLSELFFEAADPAVNDARFAAASRRQADLELKFGAPLSFEPLPLRKGCRIGTYMSGGAVDQKEMWDEYVDWFIDTQTRLRSAIDRVGGIASLVSG
jgi:hypothetical protein